MLLQSESCYRALLSRDVRFDGRFFVGVSSTGIYCRPVCRVRTPRAANCRFFESAAAAEAAGFRPCLRCRPELAPGFAAIDGSDRLARAAAALLEDGCETNSGALALRLGVSERHLRRVFDARFGVSPAAFVRTSRLLMAKRLLCDTTLPVTGIAFATGFASLRTFNAAFRSRYRLAPTQVRQQAGSGDSVSGPSAVSLQLAFRTPFDWARLLRFLGRRSVTGVEAVEPASAVYRRAIRIEQGGHTHSGWLEAGLHPRGERLAVRVSPSLVPGLPAVLGRLRRLFDLDCVPSDIEAVLGAIVADRPGLRVPGCFDGFEMAVRAVLGQQVTVGAATTLAGRFALKFGDAVETPWPQLQRAFPAPARIAAIAPEDIAALGIIGRRAAAIVTLAQAMADGELELSPAAHVPETLARLQALPGIGRWTAEYIAMRALAWPDAFPAGDFGIRSALGGVSEAEARSRAEAWRPWRAYGVMHLWAQLEEGT